MIKKTLITAAIVGVTALGAVGAANAHYNGNKHPHNAYGEHIKVKKNKKNKFKNVHKKPKFKAPKYAEYGHKKRRHGYDGPKYRNWGGFPPYVIRQTLKARGFRRIAFKDRQLPLYVVKACKRGKRFVIGLNRWGGIMWKQPRGYCRPNAYY